MDESLSIASNCPKYADMLAESVKDLEDWNSLNNNSSDTDELGFKEMVVSIAKEKGDNGKVAFLECLGLNLSSATGVARYLSSESLPVLSYKEDNMRYLSMQSMCICYLLCLLFDLPDCLDDLAYAIMYQTTKLIYRVSVFQRLMSFVLANRD